MALDPYDPYAKTRVLPGHDDLLRVVHQRTAGRYDVLGELGRDAVGSVGFLARERQGDRLVAITVARDERAASAEPFSVSVARTLDASVPALGSCPRCGAPVTDWRTSCARCGTELFGSAEEPPPGSTRADLLREVRSMAAGTYDVLGEMQHSEGGGIVYFARELASGQLAALRLRKAGENRYELGLTQVMPSVPQAISSAADVAAPAAPTLTKICPTCNTRYEADEQFCPRDGAGLRPLHTGGELVGQILADKYRVLKKLGAGAMGVVYLAEHVLMRAQRAVKVMHRNLLHDREAIRRFNDEASTAALVNHPNVVTVFDFGEERDGLFYLVMEYVEGETLKKLVQPSEGMPPTPLPPARAAEIARQIGEGLSAAHDLPRPLVHRDLKPENIMIGKYRDGRDCVKVVDFGIAKIVQDDKSGTKTGFVVGTPEYMSPEQLSGAKLDARSDIYSLGLVSFYMLTGKQAFQSELPQEAMMKRLTHPALRLAEVRPDVAWPSALQSTMDRVLARAPTDRYQTAREFTRDLVRAIDGWQRARESWVGRLTRRLRELPAIRAPRLSRAAAVALGVAAILAVLAAAIIFRPPVAGVESAPASATIDAGQTAQLAASVRRAPGSVRDVPPVTWSTNEPTVAEVSGTGLVSAIFPGSATISATSGGKRAQTNVTVTATGVAIRPSRPIRLRADQTVRLQATVHGAEGKELPGVPVTWTTSDAAITRVEPDSGATTVATATGIGSATLTATAGGRSVSVPVTVAAGPTGTQAGTTTSTRAPGCADIQSELDAVQALTDSRYGNEGTARRALQMLSPLVRCARSPEDHTGVHYHTALAHLLLGNKSEACRNLRAGAETARGTSYQDGITYILNSEESPCSGR